MFYNTFKMLCDRKGVSCNKAALEIGLSNATPTKWKKTGATPASETLQKIASYFGVSVGYLLGEEEQTHTPHVTENEEIINERTIVTTDNDQSIASSVPPIGILHSTIAAANRYLLLAQNLLADNHGGCGSIPIEIANGSNERFQRVTELELKMLVLFRQIPKDKQQNVLTIVQAFVDGCRANETDEVV